MNKQKNDESSIYFKCDYCSQEFTLFSFRIAVYLYGVIFLADKKHGYVGIVCPNCLKTTLTKMCRTKIDDMKKSLGERVVERLAFIDRFSSDLDDDKTFHKRQYELDIRDGDIDVKTMELADKERTLGTHNFLNVVSELKYDSFILSGPIPSESQSKNQDDQIFLGNDFDLNSSYKCRVCNLNSCDMGSLWPKVWDQHPEDHLEYNLCSYTYKTSSEKNYFWVYWFKETDITLLLSIENHADFKIFPRYFFDNKVREMCVGLGGNNRPILSESDEIFYKDSNDIRLQEIWNYDFLLALNYIDVCCISDISDLNIGIDLMKVKDPFKGIDIPNNPNTVVLKLDDEMKSYPNSMSMFESIVEHISKNDVQEILHKMSFEFGLEFDELQRKRTFSTGYIWELKQKYLKEIYDSVLSSTKRKQIREHTPRIVKQKVKEAEEKFKGVNIVSQDYKINEIKVRIPDFVRPEKDRIDVLITGETGTGKELIAEACHEASGRKGQFVTVNCSAIPLTSFESELFGHTKGAFTGATTERKGKFKEANKGTIFLDEIGEMAIELQAKLLRVIENREIQPLGKDRTEKVDVMLIMATNKDLIKGVEDKRFRKDLFYRIRSDVVITIPPLRDRQNDIPLLIKHFVQEEDWERKQDSNLPKLNFSQDCLKVFKKMLWDGNVRQLQSVVKRIVNNRIYEGNRFEIMAEDISDEDLQEASSQKETESIKTTAKHHSDEGIISTLQKNSGNRTHTAKQLGMSPRQVFRRIKEMEVKGVKVPPPLKR